MFIPFSWLAVPLAAPSALDNRHPRRHEANMQPELGIIEGYFGRAWSWTDRAAVVSRLAPAGYRFFHYAPKIDTKLRREWRVLHDAVETEALGQFAGQCRAAGMRFGVGLTPYGAHLDFDDAARAALKAKLEHLDSIGLDDLAILFDDMRGDFPDLAERQAEIVAFVLDHARATRFFMCPSYYCDDPLLDRVFGQRPEGYLEELGCRLDPKVNIYWTGEEVCSAEYSCGHLGDVAVKLGRKISLWDNYPVNDGPRMSQQLHLRAFTGRPANAGEHVAFHAINPASQPILGCIPALTLPMVYERGDAYRYGAAFVEAAEAVCGAELAAMLQANILMLQDGGLLQMADDTTAKLIAKYGAMDHPAAREIVDWLKGGYAITGEELQTQ
jgi:hyaluronoglucosaminidase